MSQRGFVKHRGNSWTAYWKIETTSGWKQRSKGGFTTKREATAFLIKTLASLQTGTFADPSRLTLGEYLVQRWLPMKRESLRVSTFDSYRRNIELHILPALGHVALQQLTADQLDGFYAEQRANGRLVGMKAGLAPKTVRHLHTVLHRALADAVRKNLVTRNVADAADPPKLVPTTARQMSTWNAAQLKTFLLGVKDDPLGPAYWLSATTGMRRGEILGLRWKDIDFTTRRISINQTVLNVAYKVVMGTPKTARSRRAVAVDPATLATLEHYRHQQHRMSSESDMGHVDGKLVFARPDGSPLHPDLFSQSFERAIRRLGLPRIRLHDLRHTHATLGLAAGIPAKVISDRLGHATVAFTQDVYMHEVPHMEDAAAQQIADLVFGKQDSGTE